MSFESFLTTLGNSIKSKLNKAFAANENSNSQMFAGNYSIDSSIFANADLNTFKEKIAQGLKLDSNESIFYDYINTAGVEEMFEMFDKDGDGVIEEDEINEVASKDNNDEDLSIYDLNYLFNSIPFEKILENYKNQIEAINALNNYSTKNLPSCTSKENSVPVQSQEETIEEKIEKIENEEIPDLESQKQKITDNSNQEIEEQNKQLKDLIKQNEETLGILGDNYNNKQKETNECDEKINEHNTNINSAKSEKFKYESSLSNLEGELNALDTNTKDEEINTANKQRKSEIETQIEELNTKIENINKKIEELEKSKEEQEKLKATKEKELATILGNIEKQNPKLSQQIQTIQDKISEINTEKETSIAEIDKQIEVKRNEVTKYQAEIGKKTGEAQSGPFAQYNAEKGEALAKSALNVRGTTGWCLAGVNDSLENTNEFGQRLSFSGAYEAISALQGKVSGYENLASQFQEVSVSREDLKSLPAGTIVVWDRSAGHQWGHISIALGDGRESSDHITTQMTNRNAEYHVFIPV